MAAICWCRCHDIDSLQRIGWITQAAASLALESPRSVPEITPEKLDQELTQVLFSKLIIERRSKKMIVKQLYSIIHVDEAIQTMEAGPIILG